MIWLSPFQHSTRRTRWPRISGSNISGDPGAAQEIDYSITIPIPVNGGTEEKTKQIIVTANGGQTGVCLITQAATAATLTVTPTSLTLDWEGAEQTLTVASNTTLGDYLMATVTKQWGNGDPLTLVTSAGGIAVTSAENLTGADREMTIRVQTTNQGTKAFQDVLIKQGKYVLLQDGIGCIKIQALKLFRA